MQTDPDRVKHLEFVQGVVTRLGTNSFLIKGWALTIAAAFFAVLANEPRWRLSVAALIPLLAFWLLDSYYLRQERLFRQLYDDVRHDDPAVEPFAMDVRRYRHRVKVRKVILSVTLFAFYGGLLAVNLAFLLWSFYREFGGH